MGGILEIGRSTYRRQNLLGNLFIVCHFYVLLFQVRSL